jgi:hypothetical protein
MNLKWQLLLGSILLVVMIYFSFLERRDTAGRKYVFPPGPRGLPLLGNFFQLPHGFGQGVVAKKWADQYGEMYYHRSTKC